MCLVLTLAIDSARGMENGGCLAGCRRGLGAHWLVPLCCRLGEPLGDGSVGLDLDLRFTCLATGVGVRASRKLPVGLALALAYIGFDGLK